MPDAIKAWKVYGLVDPRDGCIRYVGCTSLHYLCNRLNDHVSTARRLAVRSHGARRREWIREILEAEQRPTIVELARVDNEVDGHRLEREWIEKLRPALLNECDGGPGAPNPSQSTRERKAEYMRQRWANKTAEEKAQQIARLRSRAWTPEANAKRAKSRSWYKPTPETLEKMRQARLGTKHSPEWRAAQSAGQLRRQERLRQERQERSQNP